MCKHMCSCMGSDVVQAISEAVHCKLQMAMRKEPHALNEGLRIEHVNIMWPNVCGTLRLHCIDSGKNAGNTFTGYGRQLHLPEKTYRSLCCTQIALGSSPYSLQRDRQYRSTFFFPWVSSPSVVLLSWVLWLSQPIQSISSAAYCIWQMRSTILIPFWRQNCFSWQIPIMYRHILLNLFVVKQATHW